MVKRYSLDTMKALMERQNPLYGRIDLTLNLKPMDYYDSELFYPEFSEEDKIFYGKVLGIRSLISYEGENATELIDDFHQAVDDYLEVCKETGKSPSKEFKGSFNVRVTPELHRSAYFYAHENGLTLNELMSRSLKNYLDEKNIHVQA